MRRPRGSREAARAGAADAATAPKATTVWRRPGMLARVVGVFGKLGRGIAGVGAW